MPTDLIKELTQLGLQDREAQVYVLLLQHGRSTAQTVAQAAGLPRASCYGILENLAEKNLVSLRIERGQREYVAEPPERLRGLLRAQAEEVQERLQRIDLALPQLLALATDASVKPQVRLYKGAQDLRQLQEAFRDWEGETIQLIGYDALMNLDAARQVVTREQNTLRRQGKKTGRAIVVTDKHVAPTGIFETRTLPASLLDVPGELTVCGDRVLLFGYQEDVVAVEVRSPAIAQTCKAILELAWRLAGDLEQKFKGQ